MHEVNTVVFMITLKLRTNVSPTAAEALTLLESTDEYPPTYMDVAPPYMLPPNIGLAITEQLVITLFLSARMNDDTSSSCSPAERPTLTDTAPPYPAHA